MPNLVCRFCKTPIYAAPTGYLHTDGSTKCLEPQVAGLENVATPWADKTTYPAHRAILIARMTNCTHSYAGESPERVLELILADARHFADANGLHFDEYQTRSYAIYLEDKRNTQFTRYSDAQREASESPTQTASANTLPPTVRFRRTCQSK